MDRPQYMTSVALKDMKLLRASLLKNKISIEELQLFDGVATWMKEGQKFLLPDEGFYFEDKEAEHYTGNFRLPFPTTVLEFNLTTKTTKKMIVVAREQLHHDHQVVSVVVLSLQWGEWVPMPVVGIMRYHELSKLKQELSHNPKFGTWSQTLLRTKFAKGDKLPDVLHAMTKEEQEYIEKRMCGVLNDAMVVLLQMCSVLNCSNVRHETTPEPKFINMKRAQRGEPKLDTYRILTVDDRERVVNERGEPGEPTGVKRRQHVRRGHIRHYKTGQTIWINQMIVAKQNPVMAHKDYKVRAA